MTMLSAVLHLNQALRKILCAVQDIAMMGIYCGKEAAGKEYIGMKKLFYYADKYIEESDWRDLAMLKFCLFAMGVLAGVRIPKKNRKQAGWIAAAVFTATYIPLMVKFFSVLMEREE